MWKTINPRPLIMPDTYFLIKSTKKESATTKLQTNCRCLAHDWTSWIFVIAVIVFLSVPLIWVLVILSVLSPSAAFLCLCPALYLQEELSMRDSVSSKLLIRSMTGLPSQCFALGYLLRSCIINDWLKNSGTLHEEDLITCLALKFLLGRVCKLLCVSALEVHLRGSFSLFQSNFRDITNIFFQSLPFLTQMHTIMFQSPNKGKNAGHLQHVDPIIVLMHPIFGYICSNVLFHLSSPHFHHSHSPRALCLNFWVWWTHITQPMCSQNSGMISSYCVPALHNRALMYPFMSISLLIVKTCKSSELN